MNSLIGLFFGLFFAAWVNRVAKKEGVKSLPWIIGTVLMWPVATLAAGWRFRRLGLTIVGCIGCVYLSMLAKYLGGLFGSGASAFTMTAPQYALWLVALGLAFKKRKAAPKKARVVMFAGVIGLVVSTWHMLFTWFLYAKLHHELQMSESTIGMILNAVGLLALLSIGLLIFATFDAAEPSQDNATRN